MKILFVLFLLVSTSAFGITVQEARQKTKLNKVAREAKIANLIRGSVETMISDAIGEGECKAGDTFKTKWRPLEKIVQKEYQDLGFKVEVKEYSKNFETDSFEISWCY